MALSFPGIISNIGQPTALDIYMERRKQRNDERLANQEMALRERTVSLGEKRFTAEQEASQQERVLAQITASAQAVKPYLDELKPGQAIPEQLKNELLNINPELANDPQFQDDILTEDEITGMRSLIAKYGVESQKPEDYTLAPGAQRRGANNQILAENPANKPAKGSSVNVLTPDGKTYLGIENEDGSIVDAETGQPFPRGSTKIGQNVTATSVGGLTQSQQGARLSDAMDSFQGSTKINESISSILPKIIGSPGAAGTTGRIASFAGNAATILLSEDAGDKVAEIFSGMNQEELSKIETQMKLLRSQLRPLVTGDAGSRQSESERQLAGEAIGYIEQIKSTADLAQAYPKVIGSLKQLMVESYVNQYQKAKNNDGVEYPFDLTTDSGMEDFAYALFEAGLDEDTIGEAMDRALKIQKSK